MKGTTVKRQTGLLPVLSQPLLQLSDFYTPDLPAVDDLTFPLGHADSVTPQLFLNDRIGDCAIAGSIEEIRVLNAARGVTVNFTDATAVQNYTEATGYQPGPELEDPSLAGQNPTDQGTDVHALFEYRKNTGIIDADGNRHKVIAYAGLTPGNWDEMLVALSLFEVVGIGFQVPDYAEAQFEAGQPWHLIPGHHKLTGGHYVPIVGAPSRALAEPFSWGGKCGITAPFYTTLSNVAVVAITEDMFTGGKTVDGIDRDKLAAALGLYTGPVMASGPRGRNAAPAAPAETADTIEEL